MKKFDLKNPRAAFSLVEILFATSILAFAMIPVFGLMTTGVMRTDLNVGYSNAIEVASATMNSLLSEQLDFLALPDSGTISAYPLRGWDLAAAEGNVADNILLNDVFPAMSGWSTSPEGTRTIKRNGISYHIQLWVSRYEAKEDLNFGYFEDPVIHWGNTGVDFPGNANRFHRVHTINKDEFDLGYSPYVTQLMADAPSTSRILRNPWGQTETTLDQEQLSGVTGGPFLNFAKVIVRCSWGYANRKERGRAKDFYLISFKADLSR